MIALDHGHIVVQFFSKAKYLKILTQGPWIVMGHNLTVTTWRPNFCPAAATISSILVWVRFPEMPIEFFNKELLLRMGNQIGKATKVDEATTSVTHGRFS